MRFFAGPRLLIIDEVHYLPLSAEAAAAGVPIATISANRNMDAVLAAAEDGEAAPGGDAVACIRARSRPPRPVRPQRHRRPIRQLQVEIHVPGDGFAAFDDGDIESATMPDRPVMLGKEVRSRFADMSAINLAGLGLNRYDHYPPNTARSAAA